MGHYWKFIYSKNGHVPTVCEAWQWNSKVHWYIGEENTYCLDLYVIYRVEKMNIYQITTHRHTHRKSQTHLQPMISSLRIALFLRMCEKEIQLYWASGWDLKVDQDLAKRVDGIVTGGGWWWPTLLWPPVLWVGIQGHCRWQNSLCEDIEAENKGTVFCDVISDTIRGNTYLQGNIIWP
jgi:hypothetical protein